MMRNSVPDNGNESLSSQGMGYYIVRKPKQQKRQPNEKRSRMNRAKVVTVNHKTHVGLGIQQKVTSHKYNEYLKEGKSIISFNDFMRVCGTGDMVLFESISVFGLAISVGSLIRWSHVAMIVKLDPKDPLMPAKYRNKGKSRVFLWESVRHNETAKDIITGITNKSGPQLVDFKSRIRDHVNDHEGSISIRKLDVPPNVRRNDGILVPDRQKTLRSMLITYTRSIYETNKLRLLDSLFKCIFLSFMCSSPDPDAPQEEKEYFCSQLQAEAYLEMGVILPEKGRETRHYTLKDFTENDQNLVLAPGYFIHPEKELVMIVKRKDNNPRESKYDHMNRTSPSVGQDYQIDNEDSDFEMIFIQP